MNISKKYSSQLLLALLLPTVLAGNAYAESSPSPVYLGSAATFAILSQSGIY